MGKWKLVFVIAWLSTTTASADYNSDYSVNDRQFCHSQHVRVSDVLGYVGHELYQRTAMFNPIEGYILTVDFHHFKDKLRNFAFRSDDFYVNNEYSPGGAVCGDMANKFILELQLFYDEIRAYPKSGY